MDDESGSVGHVAVLATVGAARPTLQPVLVLRDHERQPALLSDLSRRQQLLGETVRVGGV